jgi:hypothetical protein
LLTNHPTWKDMLMRNLMGIDDPDKLHGPRRETGLA